MDSFWGGFLLTLSLFVPFLPLAWNVCLRVLNWEPCDYATAFPDGGPDKKYGPNGWKMLGNDEND